MICLLVYSAYQIVVEQVNPQRTRRQASSDCYEVIFLICSTYVKAMPFQPNIYSISALIVQTFDLECIWKIDFYKYILFPRSQYPTTVHQAVDLRIITLPSCPPATCLNRSPSLWGTTRHIRQAFFFPPIFRGSNLNGQINIILNTNFFLIFLNQIDGWKCVWKFPHWNALQGLLCSCFQLLLVSTSLCLQFCLNWKACSIGLRSGDWLGHWRI